MKRRRVFILIGVVGVIGAAVGGGLYCLYPVQVSTLAGMTRNYFISWSAPPSTTTTELNATYKATEAVSASAPAAAPSPNAASGDWPSYNKTPTSERYSELIRSTLRMSASSRFLCT